MDEDFEKELEKKIEKIKDPVVKVSFPEWPNSFYSFPYQHYLQVPFIERFDGEWFLFRSNHEIFEERDQFTNGLYPVKCETFIKYRINSLQDEKLKNQYWANYANFLEEKLKQKRQPKTKNKIKIDAIALKYVYEGLQITRENGNEIVEQYGHKSGEKLFQRFSHYSSAANRKGKPIRCTPRKLDNKIKLIESVIQLLPPDKQERAKDEVSILKKIYESEYE